VEGATADAPIELPSPEIEKFRKVLRLERGAQIAVLPNDGTLIRCAFEGRQAIPIEVEYPGTEPKRTVVIAQALPKGDRLETVVRMGTEIGVSKFAIFHSVRSIARWEPSKIQDKVRRLSAIVREAAEQSYRCRLPEIEWVGSLESALKLPNVIVLSEREGLSTPFRRRLAEWPADQEVTIVVGPEGGWDPKEVALIEPKSVTLGALVLRTDTASIVAATLALAN
jgi:16S rRNA (uracil1498-N3)-methyltransferase